jgi:hypothetical protein
MVVYAPVAGRLVGRPSPSSARTRARLFDGFAGNLGSFTTHLPAVTRGPTRERPSL